MIVHFEDQDYSLDFAEIDLRQARYLKNNTGLTIHKLRDGLKEFDPDALAAIFWLMKAQNGKVADISKVNFKIFEFWEALAQATTEDEENPTPSPQKESGDKTTPSPKK